MQLPVGEHILREDVPSVVARAAGREAVAGPDLAAILKCFLLDVSATMSWPEFQRSWAALQALAGGRNATPGAAGRARGHAAAVAALSARQPAAPTSAVRPLAACLLSANVACCSFTVSVGARAELQLDRPQVLPSLPGPAAAHRAAGGWLLARRSAHPRKAALLGAGQHLPAADRLGYHPRRTGCLGGLVLWNVPEPKGALSWPCDVAG